MNQRADKPKRKRHWFRFRLRTLLIAMLLLGVGLGLVGMRLVKYRRAKATVQWIHDNGGQVAFHYEPGPWWKQIFQSDFADSVKMVRFMSVKISDLSPLHELTQLQSLIVSRSQVSDLAPLSELIQLERITALHHEPGTLEAELDDGQRVAVSRRLVSELKRRLGVE